MRLGPGGVADRDAVLDDDGLHARALARTASLGPAGRGAGAASRLHVLLRLDRRLPWTVVEWLMGVCGDPSLDARQLLFEARLAGDEEPGGIAYALPGDRGRAEPEEAHPLLWWWIHRGGAPRLLPDGTVLPPPER